MLPILHPASDSSPWGYQARYTLRPHRHLVVLVAGSMHVPTRQTGVPVDWVVEIQLWTLEGLVELLVWKV